MRFPLAAFCALFSLTMLAAAVLPVAALYAVAGVLAAAFVVAWWGKRRGKRAFGLALVACLLALLWRGGYTLLVQRPASALAGTEARVQALVTATQPCYGEETVHATLRLDNGLAVQVQNLPQVAVGQVLSLPLRFYDFSTTASRNMAYAKGRWVGASLGGDGDVEVLGVAHTLSTRLRQLQYAASDNIRARLPLRLSGASAAMSVGDRRYVPYEVTAQYRAAGLSHLLVVSGLHLSLLAGAVYGLLGRVLPRRRAALAGLGFVVLFALFTGLTPSILRSGFMWGMIFLGDMLGRRAHAPTSLALAVCLMTLQNPWAAVDVGLQLSVTATLGMLLSGHFVRALQRRFAKSRGRFSAGKRVALAAAPSACATVFTLPVLVAAQMGVSLLAIPANLVALPLMPAITISGFAMALPLHVPVLNWIGTTGALIGGVLLRVLELVCRLCAALPWAYVPVGGGFALCALLVVYALVFLGLKTGRLRAFSVAAAGLLALSLALNLVLSAGTVRVVTAGSSNPSLVVIKGGEAVVLYRSRLSASAIASTLWQYRVKKCVLLVDMRQTTQSTEYLDLIQPQQVVTAKDDLLVGGQYAPINGVVLTVVRQSGGTAACVDVVGYKVGCYTGAVDWAPYAEVDVLLAGSGKASGPYGSLLCAGSPPEWANESSPVLQSDGQAGLWLRPGKSVILREVLDG